MSSPLALRTVPNSQPASVDAASVPSRQPTPATLAIVPVSRLSSNFRIAIGPCPSVSCRSTRPRQPAIPRIEPLADPMKSRLFISRSMPPMGLHFRVATSRPRIILDRVEVRATIPLVPRCLCAAPAFAPGRASAATDVCRFLGGCSLGDGKRGIHERRSAEQSSCIAVAITPVL